LPRLIEAFNMACESNQQSPLLVVAGGRGKHFASAEFEELQKNSPRVRFLGYVSEADLPLLYSGALAYLSASLYEGFGLTPLEAMACETAVAVSDLPPHREVAGDAALFFDATNVNEMSTAIKRLTNESELRAALIEKGMARLSLFSWQAHALKLLEIIESTTASSRK
jgi:glycosyltransferase involved in cell wall biosynthesis